MVIWYNKTHQWYDDKTGEVGLTPYATEQLGIIVFIDMEGIKDIVLEQSKEDSDPIDCIIESGKAVGDIYCPVSGTVSAINLDLIKNLENINENPMGSWLFKIDASNFESEKTNLMNEIDYKSYCNSL